LTHLTGPPALSDKKTSLLLLSFLIQKVLRPPISKTPSNNPRSVATGSSGQPAAGADDRKRAPRRVAASSSAPATTDDNDPSMTLDINEPSRSNDSPPLSPSATSTTTTTSSSRVRLPPSSSRRPRRPSSASSVTGSSGNGSTPAFAVRSSAMVAAPYGTMQVGLLGPSSSSTSTDDQSGLKAENVTLRRKLEENSGILQQLLNESSVDRPNDRRLLLLKAQNMHLERQVGLLQVGEEQRQGALADVSAALTAIKDSVPERPNKVTHYLCICPILTHILNCLCVCRDTI
jgi:hypothetical protein